MNVFVIAKKFQKEKNAFKGIRVRCRHFWKTIEPKFFCLQLKSMFLPFKLNVEDIISVGLLVVKKSYAKFYRK